MQLFQAIHNDNLMLYKIRLCGVAPKQYPTETFFALLYNGTEQPLELPKEMPFSGEWGNNDSVWETNAETSPLPFAIDMVWLSLTERKFYTLETQLPIEKMKPLFSQKNKIPYDNIIIGMAPYGRVALWGGCIGKSTLLLWVKGQLTSVDIPDFLPENPHVKLEEYCDFYIIIIS